MNDNPFDDVDIDDPEVLRAYSRLMYQLGKAQEQNDE